MSISLYIPEALKDYIKILLARHRYPGRFIATPYVCKGAKVGKGSVLQRLAVLGPTVTMGDNCCVGTGVIIPCGHIGNYTGIAAYTQIGMGNHPIGFLSTSSRVYGPGNIFGAPTRWDHFDDPPEIGSDVWIGSGVFVRQGIKIGHGAVIGAGAVVVKDIPPYTIAAGVPARVIRDRFKPDTVRRLLESKWWELSVEQLQPFRDDFFSPLEEHALEDEYAARSEVTHSQKPG